MVNSSPVAVGRGDRDGSSEDEAPRDAEGATVADVATVAEVASVSVLHGEYTVSVARGDAVAEVVTNRLGLDGA